MHRDDHKRAEKPMYTNHTLVTRVGASSLRNICLIFLTSFFLIITLCHFCSGTLNTHFDFVLEHLQAGIIVRRRRLHVADDNTGLTSKIVECENWSEWTTNTLGGFNSPHCLMRLSQMFMPQILFRYSLLELGFTPSHVQTLIQNLCGLAKDYHRYVVSWPAVLLTWSD